MLDHQGKVFLVSVIVTDGAMVKRWAASAFLATEKNFRRLDGYRDLWILKAVLDEPRFDTREEVA